MAGQEAAGAAGGVKDDFAQARVGALDHELGDGARGVVLTGVARALEVAQDLLVDVAEQVAVFGAVEVDALVQLIDDLPQEGAGLHVVVGILKCRAQQVVARGGALQVFKAGKKLIVDEFLEFITGDALRVRRPVAPAELLWQRRAVVIAGGLHFLFLGVEDLQE